MEIKEDLCPVFTRKQFDLVAKPSKRNKILTQFGEAKINLTGSMLLNNCFTFVVGVSNPADPVNAIAETKAAKILKNNKATWSSKTILQYDGRAFVNVPGSLSKILLSLEREHVYVYRSYDGEDVASFMDVNNVKRGQEAICKVISV